MSATTLQRPIAGPTFSGPPTAARSPCGTRLPDLASRGFHPARSHRGRAARAGLACHRYHRHQWRRQDRRAVAHRRRQARGLADGRQPHHRGGFPQDRLDGDQHARTGLARSRNARRQRRWQRRYPVADGRRRACDLWSSTATRSSSRTISRPDRPKSGVPAADWHIVGMAISTVTARAACSGVRTAARSRPGTRRQPDQVCGLRKGRRHHRRRARIRLARGRRRRLRRQRHERHPVAHRSGDISGRTGARRRIRRDLADERQPDHWRGLHRVGSTDRGRSGCGLASARRRRSQWRRQGRSALADGLRALPYGRWTAPTLLRPTTPGC